MEINNAAPILACKGSQTKVSRGTINGMKASAPAGAKYFPVHSNIKNKATTMQSATTVSGKCK